MGYLPFLDNPKSLLVGKSPPWDIWQCLRSLYSSLILQPYSTMSSPTQIDHLGFFCNFQMSRKMTKFARATGNCKARFSTILEDCLYMVILAKPSANGGSYFAMFNYRMVIQFERHTTRCEICGHMLPVKILMHTGKTSIWQPQLASS